MPSKSGRICLPCKQPKKSRQRPNIETKFLRLLKSGEAKTQKQAVKAINMTLRQAQRIWKNYQLNGLKKLITPNQSTYIGKLSTTQMSHPRRFLLDDQASTLNDIKDYISGSLGVNTLLVGSPIYAND